VLQAGIILVVFVALVGELVVPTSERQAQTIRAIAIQQQAISLGVQHGFWARDGLRYIHVGRVYPGLQLGDLSVYELDESKQLKRVISARSARYVNAQWLLRQVKRSSLGDNRVDSETSEQETWPSLLKPELLNVVSVKPANMSALELYRYSDYLQANELDSSHYRLAFWIKVLTPVSSLVMLLIALPFIFGSQRSGGSGNRIMLGLLLGIGFFLLNRTMNHLGQVYGLDPLFSAAFPVVLVALLGVLALRRVH
jgi:lipopolysaccharide export system permease protein